MAEFFNVLPPGDALALLLKFTEVVDSSETVMAAEGTGRVLSKDIRSPHALPSFRRSTMDGYAVRAKDTFGASESLPAFLQVTGEVLMGQKVEISLDSGQAAVIHTGGMLPDDADAVVQIEHTQKVTVEERPGSFFEIEVLRSTAPGQNVIQIGEDVQRGETILIKGKVIRPQDVGALLALGVTEIEVKARPVIGIMATGDEIIPPQEAVTVGQIRDINSYTVASLCEKHGGLPKLLGIIPDSYERLKAAAMSALESCDMLVISAGSSVSARDMTADILNELGEPGILAHGVATKPGKPTILGAAGGKPLIGLPGNPVSAMIQFMVFGLPLINHLQGAESQARERILQGKVTQNISSETGREDYLPGRILEDSSEVLVQPIFGKSNLIFTLVDADGLIRIPLNRGGVLAGETVELLLF